MNFAGRPLLSRETVAAGRSLFFLSIASILTVKLEMDTSKMNLFEVPISPDQLQTTALVGLGLFWISLLVNWSTDIVALGPFNSAMSEKTSGISMDETGTSRSEIESVLFRLDNMASEGQITKDALSSIEADLRALLNNRWWYRTSAWIFVVGWSFLVPTFLSVLAALLIING